MINVINEDDIMMIEAYGQLDEYQKRATKSAIYPGRRSPLGLAYVALKLNGEAGELAEHVGKAMRDDALLNGKMKALPTRMGSDAAVVEIHAMPLTEERRMALMKELGDILWYVSAGCNELGTTLQEVAVLNLRKLRDRQLRNVQQGSGDNR